MKHLAILFLALFCSPWGQAQPPTQESLQAFLQAAVNQVTGPTTLPRDTAALTWLFHPNALFAANTGSGIRRWTLPDMLTALHDSGRVPRYYEEPFGLQSRITGSLGMAQWQYTGKQTGQLDKAGTNQVTALHDGVQWRIVCWTWAEAPPPNAGAEPPQLELARTQRLDTLMKYAYVSIGHPQGICPDTAGVRQQYIPGARMGYIERDSLNRAGGIRPLSIDRYIEYIGTHYHDHSFYERESGPRVVWHYRNTALVWSPYAISEAPNGLPKVMGVNVFQCVYDGATWRIAGVFWDTP